MASLKTKIKRLKREVKKLENSLPEVRSRYEGYINETEKKIQAIKELKKKLPPLIEIYLTKKRELNELWQRERKIIKEFENNNFYLLRLFNDPDIPEELTDKIWEKRIEKTKSVKEIESLLNGHENFFYVKINNDYQYDWEKIFYRDPSLLFEQLDSKLEECKLDLQRNKNYENVNQSFRAYKANIAKKKNEIERLTEQLEKHQRKKAIISAYQNKSRNIAGSIKNSLKKHLQCPYCSKEITGKVEADHIYPVSLGGLSTNANMVYVCKSCNRKKDQLTLREFIEKYDLDREKIENNLQKLGKKF